ncbi:MAG: ABC transporter permease subunit [Acholeplasmataceae bacterium]|nr:ABC transporter permease subunit [Acholeplasmataceae bacterium]
MKFKKTAVWLTIILLWFILTIPQLNLVSPVVVPPPHKVFLAFLDFVANGYANISFWSHIFASFGRLFVAVIIAVIIAVPLGLLCGYIKKIEIVVSTIVDFVRPLPPLAYYMVLILWLGIGNTSKIVLLFIAAFAPVYIACVQAVKLVKKDYILAAQTLGANKMQLFTNVVFPGSLPNIFTGIRTATGVAFTTLVSAEMVAAISGVGWVILDASNKLNSQIVFVGIIIIGISAIFIDKFLKLIEDKVVFWKGQN